MHRFTGPLSLLAACAIPLGVAAQEQTGTLKYRDYKSFDFVLPKDVWTKTAGGMPVAHPGGRKFRTVKYNTKLEVDTTGDGNPNSVVRGSKGYLRFTSKADGKSFRYAARFKGANGNYTYQSSCSMSGTVGGVPIMLFDLNNNGSFGEVGKDAMIVGKGRAAAYVSTVISHSGKLYELEVTEDGKTATVRPFEAETGTLNLGAGYVSRGKLEAAIVSDRDGNTFNVAGRASVTLPVGEYTLVAGKVSKGSNSFRIETGYMDPIEVTANGASKLSWGGPLMAEFSHTMLDGKVSVDPKDLRYYGKAGEQYTEWTTDAKSPKFRVHDPETGKEVGGFIFAGCWGGGFTAGSVRVSEKYEDVLVTMTFNSSMFGRISGESGKPFTKPSPGGSR